MCKKVTPINQRVNPHTCSQIISTNISKNMKFFLIFSTIASVLGNEVIPKPTCDSTTGVSVRYASTTKRVYLESVDGARGGCTTPTEIWETLKQTKNGSPLHPFDTVSGEISLEYTGSWILTEDLYVLDGITFNIIGTSQGGDSDDFFLLSDSETFINLRAHGGSLDIDSTRVISWDYNLGGPDENISNGRSYISCLSEIIVDASEVCDGSAKNTMGEGRMDVSKSEIGYLGYDGSESWGLSYKVRGFCSDKSNPEIFDSVGVYGNIYDSEIHHNYFGHYSYGHQNGDWSRNMVHDNIGYGFDPHDYSRNLTIHDNTVYSNGNHGIIASKWCTDVSIQGNEVYDSNVGIFLHRSGDRSIVKNNYVHDNRDAGVTFLESSDSIISGNVFERNLFGTRISVGSRNNVFTNNKFLDNSEYDVYMYEGNDLPVDLDTGRPTNLVFYKNVMGSSGSSIRIDQSDEIQFVENTLGEDGFVSSFELHESTNVLFVGNSILGEVDFVSSLSCTDPQSDMGSPLCDSASVVVYGNQDVYTFVPTSSPVEAYTFVPTSSPVEAYTFVPTSSHVEAYTFVPTSSPTGVQTRGIDIEDGETSAGSKIGCMYVCVFVTMMITLFVM